MTTSAKRQLCVGSFLAFLVFTMGFIAGSLYEQRISEPHTYVAERTIQWEQEAQ